MEIKLSQLLAIADKVFDSYFERGVHVVEAPPIDEYWVVEAPDWTDFSHEPKISVGSLRDDVEHLKKVLDGEMPTAVDFDRLAAVFRVVADSLSR